MERDLMLWIKAHSSPAWDLLFLPSPPLGDLGFCVVLVVGLALWHAARKEYRLAALWLGLGVSTYLLSKGLKVHFARARPALWETYVARGGYSFPSGHALAGATFYPLLGLVLGRRWPAGRRAFLGTGLLLAFITGAGRVYHGVHWPSDVLAGWTLGALQLAAGWRLWGGGAERR